MLLVTLIENDGAIRAFKAYEVKRESRPLDVATVEQLCIKLLDMREVSHRSIVSASGFSDGAVEKAKAHGVALFELKPWTQLMSDQFPAFSELNQSIESVVRFKSNLLCWVNAGISAVVPDGPSSFGWVDSTIVFTSDGSSHPKYARMAEFVNDLLYRSTGIRFPLEPARTISRTFPPEPMIENEDFVATPSWPHTHTLDVANDQLYLKFETKLAMMTISGQLRWEKRKRLPEFRILEQIPTGEVFAGAAIADWGSPEGKMFAMVFSPDSRTTHIHNFRLEAKHRNAIRRLKIPLMESRH